MHRGMRAAARSFPAAIGGQAATSSCGAKDFAFGKTKYAVGCEGHENQ